MAKGSAMGLWRGKKGNSVFYRITNSSSAQKQGIRERVYDPSNPQSERQAAQRMKLLPAQRFSNMFRAVIDRAFEGVKYGARSRYEFMRYALSMSSGFPAVPRYDNRVWPGRYLVSRGSLPSPYVLISNADASALSSLAVGELTDTHVGPVSESLLDNNSWLREGDQITFLYITGSGEISDPSSMIITPGVLSFYIDANSSDRLPYNADVDVFVSDGALGLTQNSDFIIGAAVIVSRDSETGGHLRSTSYMTVNPGFNEYLFGIQAQESARRSYQKQESVNNDWPVDTDSGSSQMEPVVRSSYTITAVSSSSYNGLVGKRCLVAVGQTSGAVKGVYYFPTQGETTGLFLVSEQGGYVEFAYEELEVGYGQVSMVPALANLPKIIYTA